MIDFLLHIRRLFARTLFHVEPAEFLYSASTWCGARAAMKNVPAPIETMPDTWIIAACPLCGAKRRYLPRDVFRGRLSTRVAIRILTRGLHNMGEMKRAIAYEEKERRKQDRFASTLVVAASVIAAVRLARDDISKPSPRLTSVVAESISLARMILDRIAH
jgi:hypothetical protein